MRTPFLRILASAAMPAVLLGAAAADTLTLNKNDVIPVVLEDSLSTRASHRGDRFSARVTSDDILPRGTRLIGRVIDVQRRREDRPAFLDLEFYDIVLPDGRRTPFQAMPMVWDERLVRRDRNGRLRASGQVVAKARIVSSGALAGLVLGALAKKPFEGLVWGTIAGIIVAEGQASEVSRGDVTLRSGTRLGAVIEDRVVVNLGRYSSRYGQPEEDWRRDDERRRPDDRDRRDGDRYDDPYDDPVRIEYRGRTLRFRGSEQPYRKGRTLMVPLVETSNQLGLEVRISSEAEIIIVEDDNSSLVLEQGTRSYRLNGRRGTLSQDITRKDGVLYVPLEVLADMKRDPVRTNGATH